jgi:regulator of protease activity HflC (stomatin/prohibitin superfamily)
MNMFANPLLIVAIVAIFFILNWIKVLKEYERGVVFRLGRVLAQPKGPGLILVLSPIDKLVRIGLRTIVLDVPPQDVITRDNVSVKVNAVVYFRVVDPKKAVIEVQDYLYATSQLSQTTLRSVLGQADLDELLSERDKLNSRLQTIIDEHTDPWGIKVSMVEIKHVDLPQEMQRAMAKQAEAERERRAKIIHAEGEQQASAKLLEAANTLSPNPSSIQLRYLQTLCETGTETSTTVLFPMPIDLMKGLFEKK